MSIKASFAIKGRNPDVLTCIANLSNDEVFTPPELANRMLDDLAAAWAASNGGKSIWADKTVRFLDPCAKSGVFLREITKRLIEGLKDEIPDIRKRTFHILHNQVYGLAITRLTSLLSRRSLYCSKQADGKHSIVPDIGSPSGNIWFERMEHTWEGNKCKYCEASKYNLDRNVVHENYAYSFLHTDNISELLTSVFKKPMHFDVVIGNPPYQMDDGGHGASAAPIYQKFVQQAIALNPRFLSMVVPSRWLFGGRGLDDFRLTMLSDKRVRRLYDYPDSRMVFPSVDVAGGICYFLWERDNPGDCVTTECLQNQDTSVATRPLLEPGAEVFVRSNLALPIVKKVLFKEGSGGLLSLPPERKFENQVSSQKPFGLRTFYRGKVKPPGGNSLVVVQSGGRAYASRSEITSGIELIDKWKVFTSKSSAEHAGQADKNGQRKVLSLSGVIPPGTVVTETYVLLGAFDSETEANNCFSYVKTKFFRFLIAARSSAQDLAKSAYSFVPVQAFNKSWSDEELYSKYQLNADEILTIESLIRPMD